MTTRPADLRDHVRAFLDTRDARLTRLDAMLRVAESPIDVAWTVCDFAGRELALEDCIVYLVDADGRTLTQLAAWGPKRVAERILENRIRLRLGEGVVGTCALTGAPQLVPDTRIDRRYVLDDETRHSELAVPMLDGDKVRGVIDSEHMDADFYWSGHIRALLLIAERAVARLALLR
jgi:GAF domain-containing protein